MTNLIETNKTVAVNAAILEAARIANKKATAMLSKSAPIMVRGYLDTAVGRLVSANLVSVAASTFRPDNKALKLIADAMITTAYQELYQELDIEGMLDSLVSEKLIKKIES